MKRILLLTLAIVMGAGFAFAQEEEVKVKEYSNNRIWRNRAGYLNVGFVTQWVIEDLSFSSINDVAMKSDLGVSLTSGKTYYLHKKPIANMVKIGLDWSWLDLNVVRYRTHYGLIPNDDGYEEYQAEAGMQFGTSVTVNPTHHLKVSAYFRVTPSYSARYDTGREHGHGNYITMYNVGGAVAWKLLSLGVEYRGGKCAYKSFDGGYYEFGSKDDKLKTRGVRFYIGFRF